MNHDFDTLTWLIEKWQHVVFWSSLISLFLAKVEHWCAKWFPKALKPLQAIQDAISEFGALNLRDKIAPRPWDKTLRRTSDTIIGELPTK